MKKRRFFMLVFIPFLFIFLLLGLIKLNLDYPNETIRLKNTTDKNISVLNIRVEGEARNNKVITLKPQYVNTKTRDWEGFFSLGRLWCCQKVISIEYLSDGVKQSASCHVLTSVGANAGEKQPGICLLNGGIYADGQLRCAWDCETF